MAVVLAIRHSELGAKGLQAMFVPSLPYGSPDPAPRLAFSAQKEYLL